MDVFIKPITFIRERPPDNQLVQVREKAPQDLKMLGCIRERLSQAQGGLLPTATAPQVLIHLLPVLDKPSIRSFPEPKRRKRLRKMPIKPMAPIGLSPVDPEGCINALMQFILSLSGLSESFYLAPRSFAPFVDFMEQYHQDQQEKESVSKARGSTLFRFFSHQLQDLSLYAIFQFLLKALHLKCPVQANLKEALETERPVDIFLMETTVNRQIFTEPDCVCYELDAFIEMRSDGVNVNFVAFVKVEGRWYQCDDERIIQLCSNHLKVPLQSSVLLHYKKLSGIYSRPLA